MTSPVQVTFPDRQSAMMKMEDRKDTRADTLLYEVLTQDTAMKASEQKAKEVGITLTMRWLLDLGARLVPEHLI